MNNQQTVEEIAGKHLGQVGGAGYSDSYDPTLLVKVPRYLNRETYGIDEQSLPFVGVDAWNAYEVSAITENGLPVAGIMKIVYDADSEYHVESKSIKLYLNSLNMSKFGTTRAECVEQIEAIVTTDLSELLGEDVTVKMFLNDNGPSFGFDTIGDYEDIVDLVFNVDKLKFDSYKSNQKALKFLPYQNGQPEILKVKCELLRSNCRVTGQPDWGTIYIRIKTERLIDLESLLKYIVSHRTVSHFHEEICEMTYMHLKEAFYPSELMVACLYTRRGGIDINPIRASHEELIPVFFKDVSYRMEKTLKQ